MSMSLFSFEYRPNEGRQWRSIITFIWFALVFLLGALYNISYYHSNSTTEMAYVSSAALAVLFFFPLLGLSTALLTGCRKGVTPKVEWVPVGVIMIWSLIIFLICMQEPKEYIDQIDFVLLQGMVIAFSVPMAIIASSLYKRRKYTGQPSKEYTSFLIICIVALEAVVYYFSNGEPDSMSDLDIYRIIRNASIYFTPILLVLAAAGYTNNQDLSKAADYKQRIQEMNAAGRQDMIIFLVIWIVCIIPCICIGFKFGNLKFEFEAAKTILYYIMPVIFPLWVVLSYTSSLNEEVYSTTPFVSDDNNNESLRSSLQQDADTAAAMSNGIAAMEQEALPEYKPKTIQTFAALLMAIAPILFIIFPYVFYTYMIDSYEDNIMDKFTLFIRSFELFLAIGCALLISVACNKAVKVAAISLTCLIIFEFCLYAAATNHILVISNVIGQILTILLQLGYVYLFALIISNSSLSVTNRSWMNLICIAYAMLSFMYTSSLWGGSFDDAVDMEILQRGDYFLYTPLYSYFRILFNILLIVAYWKFARSEAFNGKYDKDYKCNFLPLNKWMAMAVIAPFVTGVAIYLYYMILGITLQ